MNTTKTGMRTVLAAAAAGALILGSAGGAVADPGKAKGPRTSASETTTKLQTLRIKGHKKIDLVDPTTALATELKLRAKVRSSKKVKAEGSLGKVTLTLAVYDKKVNGDAVEGSESMAAELTLKNKNKNKRNQFYAGSAVVSDVWSPTQVEVLAAEVAKNGKAYICISGVTEEFDKYSKQTQKRLGMDVKKPVRDCVKVVNSATDSTPESQPTS